MSSVIESLLPLKTKRLVLRDFEPKDWVTLHLYAADPEVVRFLPWSPNSEKDSQRFVERVIQISGFRPRTHFELAIISQENNCLIGNASLYASDTLRHEGALSICLNKDFWRQGIAPEAAASLLSLGFGELNLVRISAVIDAANEASRNVLTRVGMRHERDCPKSRLIRGFWRDTEVYSVDGPSFLERH